MNTRADSFGNDFRNSCARTGRGPGDPHAARPSLERSQLSLLAEARGPCARRGTLLCCPPSASPGGRGGFIHEEKELHHPRTPLLRAQTDGPVAQNPVRVPRRGRAQRPRRQGLLQDQTRSSAPPVCHLFGRCGHFLVRAPRARSLSLFCSSRFAPEQAACCAAQRRVPLAAAVYGAAAGCSHVRGCGGLACGGVSRARRHNASLAARVSTRTRLSLIRNKRPRADALECVAGRNGNDRWLIQLSDAVRTASAVGPTSPLQIGCQVATKKNQSAADACSSWKSPTSRAMRACYPLDHSRTSRASSVRMAQVFALRALQGTAKDFLLCPVSGICLGASCTCACL